MGALAAELGNPARPPAAASLRQDGLHKVGLGFTTIEEVLSATENTM